MAARARRRSRADTLRWRTRARSSCKRKDLAASPIHGQIAAVSVGICGGVPVLDLDYAEDSQAETDMNVVMNNGGALRRDPGHGGGPCVPPARARCAAEPRSHRASASSSLCSAGAERAERTVAAEARSRERQRRASCASWPRFSRRSGMSSSRSPRSASRRRPRRAPPSPTTRC